MIILLQEKLSEDAKNILVVNSLQCRCTEMQPYIFLLMRSSDLHDPCKFLLFAYTGMDAQVAYGFHHLRNEKPFLAQGPISNKV